MNWNEIMQITVRYDAALKMKNQQKTTTNSTKKSGSTFNKNSYNRATTNPQIGKIIITGDLRLRGQKITTKGILIPIIIPPMDPSP